MKPVPVKPSAVRRILVPVDFSADPAGAVQQAVELAQVCASKVFLLHVLDLNFNSLEHGPVNAPKLHEEMYAEAMMKLGLLVEELVEARVAVCPLMREGLPCEEIAKAARALGAELIVMRKRPRKSFWDLFHRNTVKAVLSKAPCPVLLIPAKN